MADYTPVASQSKPPQQMSLAEMMNLAGGVQAYKQAQEINPLKVQEAQQILRQQQQTFEQTEKMNPLALQEAGQKARTGEIALGVEEQKDIERKNMQTFFADPNNFQTNGRIDLDKINSSVPKIAPLTGSEYITKYSTLGKAQTEAISAKQGLTKDQRALIAQRFDILGRLGVQDKNAYIKEMDLMKQENPENPDLHRLLDSYKTIWSNIMQSGPNLPKQAIAGAATLLTPEQQQTQFAPQVTMDAQGRVITTTPSIAGEKPKVEVTIPLGLQGQNPQGGISLEAAGSQVAPSVRLPYPVRRADQPYTAMPTEEKDQAAGFEYRNKLVNAQSNLSQGRRNVEEVINQANKIGESLVVPNFLAKFGFEKGGAPEKMERAVRQFFGSEQYDMLAKDLANMAITNSTAMGSVGGTVAGLDMASVANGTIKVTPDVLVKIARRVQADQRNLDMQASAAQQFGQKYGDNNMKAFQQAWNANSKDTKIFEAMNILETEADPAKLQNKFKELFPSEKKRKTILKQYRNLKSMAATGVPVEPLTAEDF
ncbi:hypothetical protein UFOVP205_43 [uncultured Caudovirales phage]|uniref:Uncharacterized protein n=1 Tax=uncultured Caudovirales phage TaxID=2100421 RepID=A0A6J7WJS3_9CAUD|nr:hypothetical protein UFOVP205_43 [uncultured Caudovirales phage]